MNRLFMATHEPVLAHAPKKVRPPSAAVTRGPVHEDRTSHGPAEKQAEFYGETCGPIRLPLNGFTYS